MPLDPRLILGAGQGVTPVDPMAFQRGQADALKIQGAQQQQQVHALQLADAQRQEQERRDLGAIYRRHVVTDPQTGQSTIDLPGAMTEAYRVNPVLAFKTQQEYTKTRAETTKTALEAQKAQTEQALKGLEFGGQVAQGVEDRIAAGADPQVAWQWGLETMRRGGFPTASITPTYDANMLAGWKGQALQLKDKLTAQQKVIDQQLRERELVETQKRTALEARKTGVQEQELGLRREDVGVRREDLAERRAERLQTRETQTQQRLGERENQLRDEFNTLSKDYRTQSDAYGRVTVSAKDPSAAGDLSMIFSYMKLLDPGSVVREGEQATAANARGIPDAIRNQYNRIMTGERLTDKQRADFLDRAQRLYDQASTDHQQVRTQYEERAQRYGVDPANVTTEFGSTARKTMTEADITATMQASGKTRQEVLDAARAKGFAVPAR